MHEIGNLVGGWEAFVDELEWVVVERLVLLKVVFLASEELVNLNQPRGVKGLAFLCLNGSAFKNEGLTGCGP